MHAFNNANIAKKVTSKDLDRRYLWWRRSVWPTVFTL